MGTRGCLRGIRQSNSCSRLRLPNDRHVGLKHDSVAVGVRVGGQPSSDHEWADDRGGAQVASRNGDLVEYLVSRSGPAKFVEFMDRSLANGYEAELKPIYGFSTFDELDREWSRGRTEQVAAATDGAVRR